MTPPLVRDADRLAAVIFDELNRQDDYGYVEGVWHCGDGFVAVRGRVHLPSIARAIIDACEDESARA